MDFKTTYPYMQDIYTVKRYGETQAKVSFISVMRIKGYEADKPKPKRCTVNEEKLDNSISRTKSAIRELALCNDWHWWVTLTINPEKYDRYNLKVFMKDLAEFLHNQNRRRKPEEKILYLLVPEQHKDGAWHLHGFINGLTKDDLKINEHGYYEWREYAKRFGYISMDLIKDKDRASSYILKYITKNSDKTITELNANSYYASKGLNRAVELYRGKGTFKGEWDYEHPDGYCKTKNIDLRKQSIEEVFEVNI